MLIQVTAKADVVRDRAAEEHGVLGHDADLTAQRAQVDGGNVDPVDQHTA